MQQRPIRYYITQDEDQTVVRSVPIARRAHAVLPLDERSALHEEERVQADIARRSVAERFRAVLHRAPGTGRR